MPTYKATFTASPAEAETIAALITEILDPPPGVSIAESGDARLVEAYFVERPDLDALRGFIAESIGSNIADGLELHEIPDENWVARVQRGLHPVRAGGFLIHGSHDRETGRGKRLAIEIDAGQAFGTAHHGTTRGCLIAIDRLAKRERWRSVLDVGTGSGILAIAAAKLSDARVLASDIDPVAVAVAAENWRRNGVSAKIAGLVVAGVRGREFRRRAPFDLITANILAGPLLALAPHVARLAARGGHIVLSGLLDSQAREVSASYRRLGFTRKTRLSLEGWTTLVLRRTGQ
jgi:ribosomal protein L11 methyltransferase